MTVRCTVLSCASPLVSDLKAFTRNPAPLPALVEPRLKLVEEFVLLSLAAERNRVRSAARVAADAYPSGPRSDEEAMSMLEERGLVSREAGSPAATDLARVAQRIARVRAIIRRPAVPLSGDGELLALLAAARCLPLENANDRLSARLRLASVGEGARDLPPAVAALVRKHGAATIGELADRLLAGDREDLKNANFDPGTSGV